MRGCENEPILGVESSAFGRLAVKNASRRTIPMTRPQGERGMSIP